MQRIALAAALPFAAATPSHADRAFEPAARCAAFWLARHDFQSRYWIAELPDAAALRTARGFRDAAYRLNGGAKAGVDAFIAEERADLLLLNKAYILAGDKQSREVFRLIASICQDLAADLPELPD